MDKPTPKVDYTLPQFDPVSPDLALECETIMYDLMALAQKRLAEIRENSIPLGRVAQ